MALPNMPRTTRCCTGTGRHPMRPLPLIREAQPSELRACASLLAEALVPNGGETSLGKVRRLLMAILVEISLVQRMMIGAFHEGRRSSQNYQLLLVDGNSGPQAVCELQTDGNTMKLSSLAVRASCRRRGLARRLLRRTVRRAKKLRCQAVQLDVYEDNVPATDLYRSVGFRRFGWTPVVNLELEALLGRTCGRWRLNLLSEEMDADSALADAEAAPTLADLGAELSKRLLYQVFLGMVLSSLFQAAFGQG
ncbi:unnamed protein product [Durusdinium trenchii]|uniref:N-acetyltransferase domain-containing protein n=1 Tax=Durusdinium trenchii TaxID=1381693 RepID=A0ABP0H546_9DINO